MALEALGILKRKYPQVKLYIAGQDLVYRNGVKEKIKERTWELYDRDEIIRQFMGVYHELDRNLG